jgi:long-chain acyl-CoA synthetase
LISFFAAMNLGAVVVNINPTYTARELQYQLKDSGAETLVLLNLFWPRLREIQSQTNLRRVIVAHIDDTLPWQDRLLVRFSQRRSGEWVDVRPEHDIFFFSRLLRKYAPSPPRIDVSVDDIALLQYTGGTTGQPKGAMLTHRNLMANMTQIAAWLPDGRAGNEIMMAAIPFFHVYGLTVAMLFGTYLGCEMVIVPNPRPIENVMHIIQRKQCTLFPGVPAMYIGIINHPNVQKYNLRSIRACISGSAPLPMEVQLRFDKLTGGRLVEGYGMTEASPVTHCNPLYGERRERSMGVPLPDVEARICHLESGEILPLGSEERGELQVRGPQIMQGYWQRSEETEAVLDDEGWLRTGDICTADSDGFFSVVDRKKDMIIVSGFKVLPREVEEVLFMHNKIQDAAVAGIPNPIRGDDTNKAFIVLNPGVERDEESLEDMREDIRAFCRMHMAPYKVPREFEFRDSLPKTAVGKVLRRELIDEELERREAAEQADQQ